MTRTDEGSGEVRLSEKLERMAEFHPGKKFSNTTLVPVLGMALQKWAAEAARMEKALEFYADKRNSTPGHRVAPGFLAECIPSAVCMERGQRAYEALGKANVTDV